MFSGMHEGHHVVHELVGYVACGLAFERNGADKLCDMIADDQYELVALG